MVNDPKNPIEPATAEAAEDLAEGQVEVVWVDEEDDLPLSGSDEAVNPASEVARLRRELAETKDQWVRTVADLDNYRKRAEREVREAKRFALFEPIRDLLSVADNLERALAAGGTVEDLKKGVEMTLLQFKDILRQHGVREIDALGADFDPSLHDAVARFEDPAVLSPKVADQLQRGYVIHDRLLRPALVRVAVPASPTASAGGKDAGGFH